MTLETLKDPLGHPWTIGYDSNHNPSTITDPLGHQSTLYVDPSTGLLNHVADSLGNTTWFGYNPYGDLYSIYDPLGNTTYRGTDAAGRVTAIFDPLRNTTSFGYDNLDHLTSITDAAKPTGGVTYFTYDGNENLLTVEDALGSTQTTTYTYDAMNRRITRKDALSKSESYQYDGNSNLTKYTDRNGHYVNYTYDGINRRTVANFQASADIINYTWDGGDRLTQATDSVAGTITRTPDLLDRLMKEVTPQGTVSYTYDNADRRETMTVAGQNAVNYTFDNANRLTQIGQSGTGTVGFTYDNADRRTLLTLPDSVTQAYVYDNGGHGDSHVTSLTYKHSTTTIGNLSYTYDPDGRRSSVGGSLASVVIPRTASGNIFNADNEMTTFNGHALTYDADGQTLTDTSNTYTWDVRQHLTNSHQTGINYGLDFVYDALGRRVKLTNEALGTTTQYLYDGLNPVTLTAGTSVTSVFTGLNIDEFFSFTNSTGSASLMTDTLGSIIALTDSSGAIFSTYDYEPFGRQPAIGALSSPLITIPFDFTGREDDDGTVLYYRARYYNSYLQRFISQDPMDFAGGDMNLYSYVFGDPIDLTDPYGLLSFGSVIGKVWSVPNTAIGLIYGGAQIPLGARPTLGQNGINFQNVPLQNTFGRDVTLGNVSCFGSGALGPQQQSPGQAPGITLEQHETAHTYQGETLGPLYLPAYAVGAIAGEISTGDWHNNFMESGPMSNPPVPWK